MKEFNITGTCIPSKHYMVNISDKLNKIIAMIEKNKYFTINCARQYGKTTTLAALFQKLKDRYIIIRLSFEGIDDNNFKNSASFVNMFIQKSKTRLRQFGLSDTILTEWEKPAEENNLSEENSAFDRLSEKITYLCENAPKEIILLIDEADKSSNNEVFLNFLGMLRNKYLDREEDMDISFKSVILAGVYDIKNLKLKINPNAEKKYNSPWNIAADFNIDMSFSINEIADMLGNYESDYHTGMDILEISKKIHFYTNGYPFLVSWLCKWIDEEGNKIWTAQNITCAEGELLKRDTTLFDDLIKNIENNKELNNMITGILFDGLKVPFVKSDPVIKLGYIFGILGEKENVTVIANIIFDTYLYNHIIIRKIRESYSFGYEKNQFITHGRLNMEKVLLKFQEIMKAEYRLEDEKFIEKQGRLLFLCFLKPIINGTGYYYVEPETRNNTRMDIVVSYGSMEYIIELKIWHGAQYREKGLRQLEEYLISRNCKNGYLISFSFQKTKKYIQNIWNLESNNAKIFEIIV